MLLEYQPVVASGMLGIDAAFLPIRGSDWGRSGLRRGTIELLVGVVTVEVGGEVKRALPPEAVVSHYSTLVEG